MGTTRVSKKKVVGAKAPTVYKAGVWSCPRCKNQVAIMVKMSSPPACWNHIGNHIVVMERQGK